MSQRPAPSPPPVVSGQRSPDPPVGGLAETPGRPPGRVSWLRPGLARLPEAAAVALFYLLLAWLVVGGLRPGAWNRLTTEYLGGGEIEGWLWRYWWLKQVLGVIWTTPHLSLVSRIDMTLQSGVHPEFGNLLDLMVVSWPLERLLGTVPAYNVKIIGVLALNAGCAYGLARGLGASRAGAFLAGVVFGFNPYFLYEIANGRVRQAVGFSVPLYLLALWRCWKSGRVVGAGLLLALTSALYLYYGMFLLFFNVLFAAWAALVRRREPHAPGFPQRFALVHLIALMLVLPTVQPYLLAMMERRTLPEVSYHADFPAVDFLATPAPGMRPRHLLQGSMHRFAGDSPSWDYAFRTDYYRAIPLAFTLLALAPLLVLRPRPWLWVGALGLFYLLSLGPYLKVGGPLEQYAAYPGPGIRLPYVLLFKYLPFFSRLFSPLRHEVMVFAAVAVLAALHLTRLLDRQPGLWQAAVVAGVAAVGLGQMRANGVWPLQTVALHVPEFYSVLNLKPDEGIIEAPLRSGDYTEFYQTGHDRKVLWSWASAGVPRGFPTGLVRHIAQPEPIQDNAFVGWLDRLGREPTAPTEFSPEALRELETLGYRYLILHERGCMFSAGSQYAERFDRMRAALSRRLGAPVLETMEDAPATGRMPPHPGGPLHLRVAIFALESARPRRQASGMGGRDAFPSGASR